MASALRFAARRICGRSFQRSTQPYFTAAVKEEQRRLFPSISHGGSSVRRFSSSKSPNLLNNTKHGANSAAGAAETGPTSSPPLSNKMFLPFVWECSMALCAVCYAIVYVEDRIVGPFGSKDPMLQKKYDYCSCEVCSMAFRSKEQLDNTGTEHYASEKAE